MEGEARTFFVIQIFFKRWRIARLITKYLFYPKFEACSIFSIGLIPIAGIVEI